MDEKLRDLSEESYTGLDPQTLSQVKEFEKIMTEELEEYDASAGDFETLLTEDHELLEELVDECSLLAIAEAVKQSEETEQETLEIAYLNVINKLAQFSKTFHPLSEMGIERLWAAHSFNRPCLCGKRFSPAGRGQSSDGSASGVCGAVSRVRRQCFLHTACRS